jgi:hypothetical protein
VKECPFHQSKRAVYYGTSINYSVDLLCHLTTRKSVSNKNISKFNQIKTQTASPQQVAYVVKRVTHIQSWPFMTEILRNNQIVWLHFLCAFSRCEISSSFSHLKDGLSIIYMYLYPQPVCDYSSQHIITWICLKGVSLDQKSDHSSFHRLLPQLSIWELSPALMTSDQGIVHWEIKLRNKSKANRTKVGEAHWLLSRSPWKATKQNRSWWLFKCLIKRHSLSFHDELMSGQRDIPMRWSTGRCPFWQNQRNVENIHRHFGNPLFVHMFASSRQHTGSCLATGIIIWYAMRKRIQRIGQSFFILRSSSGTRVIWYNLVFFAFTIDCEICLSSPHFAPKMQDKSVYPRKRSRSAPKNWVENNMASEKMGNWGEDSGRQQRWKFQEILKC